MRHVIIYCLLILLITFFLLAAYSERRSIPTPPGAWRSSLYVAPNGSDANPGTLTQPFATLDRALRTVRGFGEQWEGDVAILLRGGTYHLSDTLVFEPADSGKNGHRLVIQPYGAEQVTLSGGTPVGPWVGPDQYGIYYTTNVPQEVEFRHLVVNGQWAQRAQHPNRDQFHPIAAWDKPAINPTSEGPKEPFGKRIGVWDADAWFVDSLDRQRLSKVEIVFERYAGSGILRVKEAGLANENGTGIRYFVPHSPARERIFGPDGGSSWQINGLALRFENSIAFLDKPGEWFLDTVDTPTLYYIPRAGENPNTSVILAPRLETLVKFAGSKTNRVHDITIRGLRFTATTWFMPNRDGFVSVYPGVDLRHNTGYWDTYLHPAAIHLEGTERITLEQNVLQALGGMGINIHDDTRETVVHGNAILEVAGVGITVDGQGFLGTTVYYGDEHAFPFPPAGAPRTEQVRIINNRIQRFGLDLWSSGGIIAAYPWEMRIEHNEISQGYGSGISLGWYGPWPRCHNLQGYPALKTISCNASTGRNRIIGNRVSAVGGLNTDVGGIYTIGHQSPTNTYADGLEIRGNHVLGMRRLTNTTPTVLAALYLDGDTSFTTIADNIFERPFATATEPGGHGMYGVIASFFLNPDEATSVPPHDIRWSDAGTVVPVRDFENRLDVVGDSVSDPRLKPHVRDSAGLLPAARK